MLLPFKPNTNQSPTLLPSRPMDEKTKFPRYCCPIIIKWQLNSQVNSTACCLFVLLLFSQFSSIRFCCASIIKKMFSFVVDVNVVVIIISNQLATPFFSCFSPVTRCRWCWLDNDRWVYVTHNNHVLTSPTDRPTGHFTASKNIYQPLLLLLLLLLLLVAGNTTTIKTIVPL